MLSFVQIESTPGPRPSVSPKAMMQPPSGPGEVVSPDDAHAETLEQVRSVARSFVPDSRSRAAVRFDTVDAAPVDATTTAAAAAAPTPPDDGFRDDHHEPGVEVLQSLWHPRKNRFRLAGAAMANFTNGLHDSAAGALLPYMERHYHVGYGLVSLIFVCTAVGSILAAVLVDGMKRRLGRARTLLVAELLMALAYVPLLTTTAPFAAVNAGFFFVGFAESVNIAIGNTFCASLQQSGAALGILHGAYGIGGISGPLIATAIVVSLGGEIAPAATAGSTGNNPADDDLAPLATTFFSRYYFLPLGLCVLTAVFCAWSFAGYERDTVSDDAFATAPSRAPSRSSSRAASRAPRARRPRGSRTVSSSQIPLRTLAESSPPTPSPYPSPGVSASASASAWEEPPSPFFASGSGSGSGSGSAAIPDQVATGLASPPSVYLKNGNYDDDDDNNNVVITTVAADEESQTPHPGSRTATPPPPPPGTPGADAHANADAHADTSVASSARRYGQRLRDGLTAPSARVVLLGALFLFQYQGAEVSIAGWVASFLLADRAAKTSVVGTITAGFWVGITLGRFLLAAVTPLRRMSGGGTGALGPWLTPRRFVYGCVAGAALFQLLVWFVPSIVGDAVAVAIVGLLLGPVYPTAAGLLMRGLSRRERVAGVSVMGAFGSAGGAAAPFITGMIAQAKGPVVLHPVVLVLAAGMLIVWYLVPEESKPTE